MLGVVTIQPGERFDFFDKVDSDSSYDNSILKGLERPWGDLYVEVVLKRTLVIHRLELSCFNYSLVTPDNLVADNTYTEGDIPVVGADGQWVWSSGGATVDVAAPLELNDGVISIPIASATSDGYLSRADWVRFSNSTKPNIKIWQYQDYGSPVGNILSISDFQNGEGDFVADYIIDGTAQIVLSNDTSSPPTTVVSLPGRLLPSNRVVVTSHIGTTVVLSGTPHTSLSCRLFYLVDLPGSVGFPIGYQEDPQFLNESGIQFNDENYVNQNSDETIYGEKTFENVTVFNSSVGVGVAVPTAEVDVDGTVRATGLELPTGAVDGYFLRSDSVGAGEWAPVIWVSSSPPAVTDGSVLWYNSTIGGYYQYDGADWVGLVDSGNHNRLLDPIHLINDGPADAFYSGSYKETIGVPFTTSEIWWTSAAKINKISELLIVRDELQRPITETFIVYGSDGSVVSTITDTISYNGAFEISRNRVVV